MLFDLDDDLDLRLGDALEVVANGVRDQFLDGQIVHVDLLLRQIVGVAEFPDQPYHAVHSGEPG